MTSIPARVAALIMCMLLGCGEDFVESSPPELNEPFRPGTYVAGPKLRVTSLVDFGQVKVQEEALQELVLENVGKEILTLELQLLEGEFSLANPTRFPLNLEHGQRKSVMLRYAPRAYGSHRDTLRIVTNETTQNLRNVSLQGRALPNRDAVGSCSDLILSSISNLTGTSKVPINQPIEVPPLSELVLEADVEGRASFEWSLVSKPSDSKAILNSTSGTGRTKLFADLAGQYILSLQYGVTVEPGPCDPVRVIVNAVPEQAVHVQLVWVTPNDQNEFDNLSGDVDLHMIRRGGTWNDPKDDCHWQSKEVDWGASYSKSDDPSLDIDHRDDVGPENINLDNPESGMRYHVGAHYFTDDTLGISTASVRLYLHGKLAGEFLHKDLRDLQFWHVFSLDWPSERVIAHNTLYPRIPEEEAFLPSIENP